MLNSIVLAWALFVISVSLFKFLRFYGKVNETYFYLEESLQFLSIQQINLIWLIIDIKFHYNFSKDFKQVSIYNPMSSNYPQLGGPNNPANKRKLIESQVDTKQLIIIDNGTQSVKIGRSGMDFPSIIIPNVAGYPHVISQNDVATPKRVYFGKDLRTIIDSKKYNVEFFYPIEHSRITQKGIDQMIDLWQYALVELMGIEPSTADLLIIDSAQNSKEYKAKIIQILFQKLKVASVIFMNSSVLSLFSVGSTIGLVTEIGHGTSTVVPVYEGFVLNHALQVSNIAGKRVTEILEEELKKNSILFDAKDQIQYAEIVKKIKENNIKVAYDYENQLLSDQRSLQQKSYELPDGSIIQFNKETVFRPAEILFSQIPGQPSQTNGQIPTTLPEMLETSLQKCNEDLRATLMKNMIFCGGCSMIPGMEDRIHRQLSNFGEDMRIQFDWQRRYSSWIGGSMIGSLSVFQQLAITNSEHSTNQIIKRIL